MRRHLEKELIIWKNRPDKLPLILRGARQVGKSFLVEAFGKNHFESLVTINFEFEPAFRECFATLDPAKIIPAIEILANKTIQAGKTLLFLDEIQECPQALLSLRYFKEKMPELHVIAAGSLLEFVIHEEEFSFPVGRIQFLYLKPLSFHEFLTALDETKSLDYLSQVEAKDKIGDSIHRHLLSLFRQYMLVGGMPAAVKAYLEQRSFLTAQRTHQVLLQTYQSDFGKYATKAQFKYLQKFFEKAPAVVAQHFKYVEIDSEARSRDLKTALQQLVWAGLLYYVHETNASGIPLQAQIDDRKFKILLLDIGLLQTAGRVDIQSVWEQDILQIRAGSLAEQIVGQELMAYQDCYEIPHLYFWKREQKTSQAEVDYLFQIRDRSIPIEVKAGALGRLKSLQLFMEEKKSTIGIKISSAPLSLDGKLLSVPLYLIGEIPRLLDPILNKRPH